MRQIGSRLESGVVRQDGHLNLLLLHPLPLDGSIWPAELWDLADAVLAPTLYSVGGSLSDWAGAVLDLAEPGPCVVVGNSVGGSCALELANLDRGRVRGLVLIGAKAGIRPEPAFRDEAIRLLRDEGVDAAWDRYWAPLFAPDADPLVVERGRAIARGLGVEAHVNGVCAFHARPDRAALLADLEVPVTIVRGEHDRIPREAERLASSLRDGRFVEVRGAGHYVPIERPHDLVSIVRQAMLDIA
jgi:pimeloyl-ACP methyl ester carboxylesterase